MFPLGHIGITAFLASLISLSPLHAILTVLIPDIIDKSLNILGLAPISRYIGHTLFLGFIFSVSMFLLTRKRIIFLSVLFGYYMHFLEDLPGLIPWFFPFVKYHFPVEPFRIRYTLFSFVTDMIGLVLLWYTFKTNSEFRKSLSEIVNSFKLRST